MSLFSSRSSSLFTLKKFQTAVRSVICVSQKKDDLAAEALKKKEAPQIPLAEFFETPEEKEKAARCKRNPLKRPKDSDLSEVNMIPRDYLERRTARIYKETRHCMQNGSNNVIYWKIQFDTQARFENALIGWCSTSDALSNLKLNFHSLAAAQEYCHRNGFDYYVDLPSRKDFIVKSYADNFSWNSRRRVSTK